MYIFKLVETTVNKRSESVSCPLCAKARRNFISIVMKLGAQVFKHLIIYCTDEYQYSTRRI